MKAKHSVLPLTFGGWDAAGDWGDAIFYDVTFTEDFGPFKSGEHYNSIAVMESSGTLEVYNEDGTEIIRSCKIKYVVVE